MSEFVYPIFAFRQQKDAPVQVAFVAHSREILEWAGVPRKSDGLLTGYQRFKDDVRITQDIVRFFQDPRNCSPTAIIVALRKDVGLGKCYLEKTEFSPGIVTETKLHIEVDDNLMKGNAVFEAALRYVDDRLSYTGETSVEAIVSDEEEESEAEAEEEEFEEQLEEEGTSEAVVFGEFTVRNDAFPPFAEPALRFWRRLRARVVLPTQSEDKSKQKQEGTKSRLNYRYESLQR